MKKFVLYTAIFGRFGRFNIPIISIEDIDKFCYTDMDTNKNMARVMPVRRNRFVRNDFYKIKQMRLDHLEARRRQRWVKICIPDEMFNNYEYSVYVDCKRPITVNFDYLLTCMKPGSDFLVRRHDKRDCIYDEGAKCIKKRLDNPRTIRKQLDSYRSEGYPTHNGLMSTFLLIRRHTQALKEFSKLWWAELEKHSVRDQLSLPYVAWKNDVNISLCKKIGRRLRCY